MRRALALLLLVNALGSHAAQSGWLPERITPQPVAPVEGPFHGIVVRESADDTPALSKLLVELRVGPQAERLAAGGHRVTIVDPQDEDGEGRPVRWLGIVGEAISQTPLPALAVLDARERVIHAGPLPAEAAAVVEQIDRK